MDTLHKLAHLFTRFPGIGPRQAARFVYFLLSSPPGYRSELMELIGKIKSDIRSCPSCQHFYSGNAALCRVCGDTNRDPSLLMLVEKDVDLDTIERAKSYNGFYFVIGGTVPILDKNPGSSIREKELLHTVKTRAANGLKEIILAFSVNPEGENTVRHVKNLLLPFLEERSISFSALGRGLSTGSELEYSDADTITNALKNRH